MKRIICILYIMSSLSIHYGCTNEENEPRFLQLSGNDFKLEVNAISEYPNVQLPTDQLNESDYKAIDYESEYAVSFSKDLQTISIMRDSISGLIIEDMELYKAYDLNSGLFAGGRFIVWITDGKFEAEFTVYGSGVPIIMSERGILVSF